MQPGQEQRQRIGQAVGEQPAAARAALDKAGATSPWQPAALFGGFWISGEPLAKMAEMQRAYAEQMATLWNSKFMQPFIGEQKPIVEPAKKDKRFRDEAWEEQPFFDLLKQSYLINAKFLRE